MDKFGKIFFGFLLAPVLMLGFCCCLVPVSARENITDWYIQDFDSEIIVNKDSSLDITEKITADCGNAVGKHGIFRIVPEIVNIDGEKVKNPVKLLGITDNNGMALKYTESRDKHYNTVTWKIGDPDKTVQGVNYYVIRYRVKNTIRFFNPGFDELYWNLTGNFWDLEIDNFHGKIIFPSEVNEGNSRTYLYAGSLGAKDSEGAAYNWSAPNILEIEYPNTLLMRQGVTASVTFPKNIFVPYEPGFWERYGNYLYFLIPFVALLFCIYFWRKYGKDPKMDKTVIPEYDAPGKLTPIEIGMLMENGSFSNDFITAEIINLAVKGMIKISETINKILFFKSKDYEFTRTGNTQAESLLNSSQKTILDNIFEKSDSVKLSSLKNNFYKAVSGITEKTKKLLEDKKLIAASGLMFKSIFLTLGIIGFGASFFTMPVSGYLGICLMMTGAILFIFSFIMPKRTVKGAELNWQIKGFKLFMETVDKDRAKFYEKENIFEKFLPYAIIFGITGLWIKRMKEIYGEDFYAHYAPAWYAGSMASINVENFTSTIDNLSASIASNVSAPSSSGGSGGGGGAGGGGGGGGGGGW